MPNTVRANARAMPEATNRRAVLGAVLAAGAAAATALPASALGAPPLSAVDRRVLSLWGRRRAMEETGDRLTAEWRAKENLLPTWAQSGDVYLRPDGSPAGLPAGAGWPVVADLSRRPVVNGVINARPNAEDLYREFWAAKEAVGWTEATLHFARALSELSDRIRQQHAERERVGFTMNDPRINRAYDVSHAVEHAIEALVPASVLALGAHLIGEIESDADEDHVIRAHRASLAAIRPQLVDSIAEDADRVLAPEAELI
jgi:hypothetical protein